MNYQKKEAEKFVKLQKKVMVSLIYYNKPF